MKAGEKRTINIDFPTDFVTPQLAGKKGAYEVDLVEAKEKVLPAFDDAFAKSYDAENMEKLREGVRSDLQNELNQKRSRDIRKQVMQALLNQIQTDLPESVVEQETKESSITLSTRTRAAAFPRKRWTRRRTTFTPRLPWRRASV